MQAGAHTAEPAGRQLVRNGLLSAATTLLPLLAGLVAVPVLIDRLGTERVGLLTLGWATIGSFSFLDLGLGRALTHATATELAAGRRERLPRLLWTYLALMAVLGSLAATGLAVATAPLLDGALDVSPRIRDEAADGLLFVALAVPAVMVGTGLRGFVEAHNRFGMVLAVRLPTTVLMIAGPAVAALMTDSLAVALAIVAVSRLIAMVGHAVQCLLLTPEVKRPVAPSPAAARGILGFGAWVTISGVAGPIIVLADRFIVGSLLSVAAVTYYTAPADVASRLSLLAVALVPVVFPAFAAAAAQPRRLLGSATACAAAAMAVPAVIGIALAGELLDLWLGADFAEEGALVAQLVFVGAFLNGLAQFPLALVQGVGRPDLAAKLHVAELLPSLVLAWVLIEAAGIEGAAVAWCVRALVDAALMFWLAARVSEGGPVLPLRALAVSAAVLGAAFAVAALPGDDLVRVAAAAVLAAVAAVLAWTIALGTAERGAIRAALRMAPR